MNGRQWLVIVDSTFCQHRGMFGVLLKGIHAKQRLDWGASLASCHFHQVKVACVQLCMRGILILSINLACAERTVALTLPFLSGNDDILITIPALLGRTVDSAAGVDNITDKVPIRSMGR